MTKEQTSRQDFVDNKIHWLLKDLNFSNQVLKWDQHVISEIRAVVCKYFVEELKICKEDEFYP